MRVSDANPLAGKCIFVVPKPWVDEWRSRWIECGVDNPTLDYSSTGEQRTHLSILDQYIVRMGT